MSVISCYPSLVHDDRELYQLLLDCQEKSIRQGQVTIFSLTQEIETIDPLAILQNALNLNPQQLHFYWQNNRRQEVVVALGKTRYCTLSKGNRFQLSQDFIQSCLQKTEIKGNLELSWAGPHFFSSFTFFERNLPSFSPFPIATVFLPQLQIVRQGDRSIIVINLNVHPHLNLTDAIAQLKRQINLLSRSRFLTIPQTSSEIATTQIQTAHPFKAAVTSALKSIQGHHFSKIVLAHTLDAIAPTPFHLVASLDNLRVSHPDCYIFSMGNGKGTNFIGASPERLISIQNRHLITDALAGSSPRGKTTFEDAQLTQKLLDNEKERREHQAVSDFIYKRLCELGLQPRRSRLRVLKLSHIQHLWTPIQASLGDRIQPLDIIAKLHPTPAVAGVPTAISCEQIRHYEPIDRSLYAAPLGWIDYQGNSEFIVGIRSAFIQGNRARLFAGAGIVSGSNPDKELAEVQLKLQTMLKALV
ncbi:MAG: isochorismate synthase [Jaaginema sp. PMC 1079.18]|nr:isochorismate synthase [Jaaginema sp. PMC 1080.18]MEC4853166.1 isochorismate synthase [Jaaginema sp. PMC 1079.18]MEC4868622.1 isochorismate synthase [Jaaginema sp. PMC 1078.18]